MPINFTKILVGDFDTLILPVFPNFDYKSKVKELTAQEWVSDISDKSKSITTFFHTTKKLKVVVLQLGPANEISKSFLYFRSVLHHLKTKNLEKIALLCSGLSDQYLANAVIGSFHSSMEYGVFKSDIAQKMSELDITIVDENDRKDVFENYQHIAQAQLMAMRMVDYPSNLKTPEYIAQQALSSGNEHGINVQIFDTETLEIMGMHALLAVGRAAEHPPRCIVMEYGSKIESKNNITIGLVGKGISYDTGGLSIKTSAGMVHMKCDMAGAATVIGVMEALARLKWNVHVVAVAPVAENSVDALSYRPGDVINSFSGKSIEVIDTDAEGRLVLVDGISYVLKNHKPDILIDLATLTGSCVATLGNEAAGLFTQNDDLAADLSLAGESVNEKVWRLPLWNEYDSYLHSDIADIRNLGNKPVAGAITAAKFLEFFTEKHPKWAHLDIAGVAFKDSEFAKSKTATAFGVRLLLEYIQKQIGV